MPSTVLNSHKDNNSDDSTEYDSKDAGLPFFGDHMFVFGLNQILISLVYVPIGVF